ncbi:MAG TPA: ABC transporter substrate-binding protein [Candidatus Binatia bacterium]
MPMKPSSILVFFFICGVFALAANAHAQRGGKAETVKIAYPSRGVTVLPLRIAQTQGFFHQEGLEAELIQMRAGITLTALTTGDLDYGAPLDSLIRASAKGQPFKAVVSFVNKPMHYLVSKPQIGSVGELRGKTIALNSFGSAEQLTLYAILRSQGIEPDKKEVQIVFLGDSPVRLEGLKRGIVDATMVLIPHVILATNSGFKLLGHAGSFMELATPGLGTTDRIIKQKPEQVKKVVRAAVRSIVFMRRNRDASVRIMMDWLALSREIAEKSYDMALESFSEDGSPTRKGVMTSIELAGAKDEVSFGKVFDTSFLQEVHAELKR